MRALQRLRSDWVRACMALALLSLSGIAGGSARAEHPLSVAHAHNDYLHEHPLLDALKHGFTSVEADVFLVDGDLLVAHTREELDPARTLKSLYLEPLRERVRGNQGHVFVADETFHLLIDIKSDAQPTYRELAKLLSEYSDIISVVRDGKREIKAVDVTISGNRPHALMAAEPVRYAGVDGRLSDLDSDLPNHFMPLISDNWTLHFEWRGTGPISDAERSKLQSIVQRTHASGRRIRFWGTVDAPAMWRELHMSGVDLINTDDLAGLEKFLRRQRVIE